MKHCSFSATRARAAFEAYTQDLSRFPISFQLDGRPYHGFPSQAFPLTRHTKTFDGVKETHVYELSNVFMPVKLEVSLYEGFGALEYTVYFSNRGLRPSRVLSHLNAADMRFEGENPVLKGIWGDHEMQYLPYSYDLEKKPVDFRNDIGRSCHITFPYFNLQHGNGGTIVAIGWAGTWNAHFAKEGSAVHFTGSGVNDFCSYLKPGETVRTPLMACMYYDGRDDQEALNLWRRWYFACTAPRESAESRRSLRPFDTCGLSGDTGRPNSDGSISEGYDTWKPSLEKVYSEGLTPDFRWIDAGWYFDAEGNTVPTDWWGTVGTWELDKVKWPGNSLKESVDFAAEHGSRTLMWFEPERVCNVDKLVERHGFKKEWALSNGQTSSLTNLGKPGCVDWLLERILKVLDENGIHMYREDFNCEPAPFWAIGDEAEGENRKGITENLYVQGHYRLWDEIIAYCGRTGKCTFVDSCASGGGRNDLETQRRGIPLLRSDADRTSTGLRLSMTTALMHWVPICGATAKESLEELEVGKVDPYIFRASYLPIFNTGYSYVHDDTLDFDLLRNSEKEWDSVKEYFDDDFYVLTPWHDKNTLDAWTAYMFFDAADQSGVVQVFRQEKSDVDTMTLKLRGVKENVYYSVTDRDGVNSCEKILGSELLKGYTVTLKEARSAAMLYVRKI